MEWTVITGDVIASSDISPARLDGILLELGAAAGDIENWLLLGETPIQTGFARRGGDSWQFAVNRPNYGLRASLYFRARLRKFDDDIDTRIAAATGDGDVKPGQDLNSAYGPAFTASGRLIDAIQGRTFMSHASGGVNDAVFRLADHISRSWTKAQTRALCLKLPPRSGPNRIIAEALDISRQAVDQALATAGYYALDAAMQATEPVQ